MGTKAWWKSKAFWSGVIGIVTGLGILTQGGDTASGIAAIVGGVGAVVGRIQATQPLGIRSTQGGQDDGPTGGTFDPLHPW